MLWDESFKGDSCSRQCFGAVFDPLVEDQRRELERRERVYRLGLPPLNLKEKTVILVDDGLATGSTMLAAIRAARKAGAARIVVSAPVASPKAADLVRHEADAVVILETPAMLFAIGAWYQNFEQLEDAEVCRLLELNRKSLKEAGAHGQRTVRHTSTK